MSGRVLRSKRSLAEAQDETAADASVASFKGALNHFAYTGDQDEPEAKARDEGPRKNESYAPSKHDPKDRRVAQQVDPSPSPSKKQRTSKYVAPAKYAHLPLLNDVLAENLLILFIGLNPGITTSETGHAYAHPSNLFWKLLFSAGITDRRCAPTEDVDMPALYSCGFTNIVGRPTKDQAELSRAEMVSGAPALEAKARQWRPEVCCLVGKGIWEAVYRHRHGRALGREAFRYGWQDEAENMGRDESWAGARVFVAASTSGASASLRPPEKEAIWKPLGDWVKARRAERDALIAANLPDTR